MNDKIETAFITTRDGKVLLEKTGEASCVRFTEKECAHMKDSVFTHNHPKGLSLSPDDVTTAIAYDVYQIRAVGEHRKQKYLYTLTRTGEYDGDLLQRVKEDLKRTAREVFHEIDPQVQAGTLTPKEANFQHMHEVLTRMAPKYNEYFTYERTEI